MEKEDFEKIVTEAIESIPEEFQKKLDNVDIIVEEEPTAEQENSLRTSKSTTVLGLYEGVPLSKRTHLYGMVMPDKICIFRKNIEKLCRTPEEIKRMVVHTIRHELAHHFGISDKRLRDLGVY